MYSSCYRPNVREKRKKIKKRFICTNEYVINHNTQYIVDDVVYGPAILYIYGIFKCYLIVNWIQPKITFYISYWFVRENWRRSWNYYRNNINDNISFSRARFARELKKKKKKSYTTVSAGTIENHYRVRFKRRLFFSGSNFLFFFHEWLK